MTPQHALELRGVWNRYPGFTLKDVSFTLPRGAIGGLIGPNGSGKTTIVKLVMNLVRRDAGEIRVFGLDNRASEVEVKSRIGFVYDVPGFWDDRSLDAHRRALGAFYPRWSDRTFRRLAEEFALPLDATFKTLSHGAKTKFALAIAMAHHADLLLLDEPTSGLDPVFRRELLDHPAAAVADGRSSVVFSTHITGDLERMADYITFVREGRLVFSSTREEVFDRWVVVKGDPRLLDGRTRALLAGVEVTPHAFTGLSGDAAAARAALAGTGAIIERATLEDVMYLTGRSC